MAAAFTVMEKTQIFLLERVEGEVKDFWPGERAEHIGVVLEVGVVFVLKVSYLEAVEGTPGEVEVRIKIFPVGEGEVLSTTEQISKMNVVIILLDMVE